MPVRNILKTLLFAGGKAAPALVACALVLPFSAPAADSQLFQEWQADPASAILPDFSFAGYAHGEQTPPQVTEAQLPVYPVRDFGAIPNDTIDDRVAIQRAIDTAGVNGGGIILFDRGRYLLNSDGSAAPLWVRHSNIILRGAGSGEDGTLLYGAGKYDWFFAEWTLPSMVHVAWPGLKGVGVGYGEWNGKEGTQDWYTGDWENSAIHPDPADMLARGIADMPRGSQRLKVDRPESFYPGQTVMVGMQDKLAIEKMLEPWEWEGFYTGTGEWPVREFIINQIMTVEAVEGQYVRFKERIEWDYETRFSIEVFPYNYIENVGVESMRMEIVITPKDDRWDANGTGLSMAHVRNGWVTDVTFRNMQSGLNFKRTMNCTATDVRLEGEPFHDSFKFLGANYSLMVRPVIDNYRIEDDGSIRNTDHGFAVQHQAAMNVYLDAVMPENCSIDLHTGENFANLYDRVQGGRHGESGGGALSVHAMPHHTFWNWTVQTTDKVPYEFPVWGGNQTAPYSSWQLHTVKPIVSGLTADPAFLTPVSVQYAAGHNFANGYFNDPRVVAEHIGTRVTPDSLYIAQLSHRLQQERGRTEPEGGIFVAIDAPTAVRAGVPVTVDVSNTLSELPVELFWSLDRRHYTAITNGSFQVQFNEAGVQELTIRAVSQSGSTNFRHHTFTVFDDAYQVVPPRSRYAAFPRSFHQIQAGPVWQSHLLHDEGLEMETSSMWIYGNTFGIVNELKDETLDFGGVAFIGLPAEGVNLTGTHYTIGISGIFKSFPQAPRLVARDVNGNWALLNHGLASGTNSFDLAGKSWIDLPARYQLPSSAVAFDVTRVTAIGLAHHILRTSLSPRSMLLRIDEFDITRGMNTLPTVVLTAPASGTSAEVGDSVALSATATDAESVVTRVVFIANGVEVASDTTSPFSASWKPASVGTLDLIARAYDTSGGFADSAVVPVSILADSSITAPSLSGPPTVSATVGIPFSLTPVVTGKAVSFTVTNLPAGLIVDPVTGQISGVPSAAGTFNVSMTASNAAGTSAPYAFSITVNPSGAPALVLSIANGPAFVVGDTISLSAVLQGGSDPVEFLVNGAPLSTDSTAPYAAQLTPPAPGTYTFQAVSGAISSAIKSVAVLSPDSDSISVTITSPADGATISGGNQVVALSGSLNDPGGDVASIALYVNGAQNASGLISGSTFSANWQAEPGLYQDIVVVGILHDGTAVHSESIEVSITQSQAPVVGITYPATSSELDFRESLRLVGQASDPDGSIIRVEIWQGTGNRGDDTFDTYLGNAILNGDGTWSRLLNGLDSGRFNLYALAVDNSGDVAVSPVLQLVRSGRFSDHPVYGDGGLYSQPLAEWNRFDLALDGDNVVLLNRERFSYNYNWLTYLPDSSFENFSLSLRVKLPHYPDPTNDGYAQDAIITFGQNMQLHLMPVAASGDGGTRLAYTLSQYVIPTIGSPVPGITSAGWHDVVLKRVGDRVTVTVNGSVIMDGSDSEHLGISSIGLGNPRLNGSRVHYDDVVLTELDASGNPVVPAVAAVTITAPADQSLLDSGLAHPVAGTFSGIQNPATAEIYSGTRHLGTAAISGNTFSLGSLDLSPGHYAIEARVTDGDGGSHISAPVVVRVGPGLSGTNTAPQVAITTPATDVNAVEFTLVDFAGNMVDADGSIDSLLMLINGNIAGAATRSGSNWSWKLPALPAGAYHVQARAIDDMGAIGNSAGLTVTLSANQIPLASWLSPSAGASIIASSQATLSLEVTDPDYPLGTIQSVQVYANNIAIGQATNSSGDTWSLDWSPRILGDTGLQAFITDSNGGEIWSAILPVTVVVDPDPSIATVFYAGGVGEQVLNDVMELSDGTLIAVGGASDMGWLPGGVAATMLTAPGLADRGTARTGFVLHMSSDLSSLLGAYQLPSGLVEDLRWIRSSNKPGDPTGSLTLSGTLDDNEYFIGRLNGNFVDAAPSGFAWTIDALTSGNSTGDQAWDVGGDGRVIYLDTGTEGQLIRFIDANGDPMVLPGLRATHFSGATNLTSSAFDPAHPQSFGPATGSAFPTATASAIAVGRDFRSTVVYELDATNNIVFTDRYTPSLVYEEDADSDGNGDWRQFLPDENGKVKRGKWPMDIFLPAINFQWQDGTWQTYGYTGYKQGASIEVPAITIDRVTNDFYIGVSAQSRFYDKSVYGGPEGHQPDFEPFVIAYAADGEQKWWSRLYTEWTDGNDNGLIDYGPEDETFWEQAETHRSPPDQYVDGLAIDYSGADPVLVVNARCHGSGPTNLWEGNQIAANPSANGFQNRFTGTEGNIHISWIGRMDANAGTLYNSTYVAGYFRNVAQTQPLYNEPIHDQWPSHNAGWPNLTTTGLVQGSIRVGTDGRIHVVGVGPRMVTTFNAYQKMPRHTNSVFEGNAPWSAFTRVFEPNLSTLAYSSSLTGVWTYDENFDAIGANNTQLFGVHPVGNGVIVVGRHVASSGVAEGNDIPVSNVPAWGSASPDGETSIIGRLSFATNQNIGPSVYLNSPANGITVVPGASVDVAATANDFDGLIERVEFYANGSLIQTVPAEPYAFTWTAPLSQQNYTLVARAYDDEGASSVSNSRMITVYTDNIAPAVSITAPLDGSAYPRNSILSVTVAASDSDGSVSSVELFANGESIGTDTSSPFGLTWSPPAGVHELVAVAVDNDGAVSESLPVAITVGGPPQSKVVAVQVNGSELDDRSGGGYFWNSVAGATFSRSNLKALDGTEITDISIATAPGSAFGFIASNRGTNVPVTENGYTFPAAVGYSYCADNFDGSTRDGHAIVRISSPSEYTFELTILSAYAHDNNPDNTFVTDFNVGGTYSTSTRRFTGGQTLTLDSAYGSDNYSSGVLGTVVPVEDAGTFILDLGVGARIGGAYINGLIIEAVPVYENTAPVADAGDDIEATDSDNDGLVAVTFDGSGSFDPDVDDSIFSHTWLLNDVEIASGPNPTVDLPVGIHTVTLLVKDEYFVESTDTVLVTLNASPGQPPVAVASSDSPGLDDNNDGIGSLHLDGTASYDPDADGSILSWTWKIAGDTIATGEIADVDLPVGSHTIVLEVRDNWNKLGTDSIAVVIDPTPGVNPVAVAPDDFSIEDTEDDAWHNVPLDGTASYDPDGDAIVSYEWSIGGGLIATGATSSPLLPVGTHTIVLTVTDQWNKKGTDTVVVQVVEPPDVAPVADAGPDSTVVDINDSGSESVTLDGSGSYDPRGTIGIVSYSWSIGGIEIATGVSPVVDLAVGTHTIVLTVVDDDGVADTDEVIITVQPAVSGLITRIGLAANHGDTNNSASGGLQWNGFTSATTGKALKAADGSPTDIVMDIIDPFDFVSFDRGLSAETVIDGVTVPLTVMQSYVATNYDMSRDGTATIRFTSTKRYRYKVTVISSVDYNDPADGTFGFQFNYGGTWGGAFSRYFTGGETVTIDPGLGPQNYDYGTSPGWYPLADSGDYQLDLQFGASSASNRGGVIVNAILIEATEVTSAFAAWISDPAFALALEERGPDDDPDMDGIFSIIEFALGLNPAVADAGDNVCLVYPEAADYVFEYVLSDDASGITVVPEWSPSLAPDSWNAVPPANISTDPSVDGFTRHEARLPVPSDGPLFFRLAVTESE